MITTHKVPYRDGELRIGWASWDDGSLTSRSVKYAYTDKSGKISRGSPELPLDMLVDMLMLASEHASSDELFESRPAASLQPVETATAENLQAELKQLKSSLMVLQRMGMDLPWARKLGSLYDEIGERYERVKAEIARRRG